ncbi:ABC transporter permease/substrate-binding protein [Lentilactobacillus senioris]|uniref:ABC transporter permease/substrate-binding protein n=1 Tax=Lentilactobacillus senioris TaxID=931534 RepID=UPI00227FF58E|nr:ABC transporter permease/substrate-binding protein [Lentilactobacillus senioris]MCY9807528.1 ABC transporter permease/substrate-binding protein [Lentilactobacillus senioris]
MNELINTFVAQRHELWIALGQHLEISLISLIIALVLAMPLAIWATRHKRVAELLLQINSVFQTIPSLALLGLLIPLVGIGTAPSIIALVIYALLPIFQNTYIGIAEIDPSLEEAADAFGMRPIQKLFKVELPIAMPVIISGIRTAMVLIVGTATLAALIGAGGLGNFILLGINRDDPALILLGAISSAVLAIILSSLIKLAEKLTPKKMLLVLGTILVLFAGGVGIATLAPKPEKIVIAGKLGSEPDILINMYKDLIKQEDPKAKVELKNNFGETSFLFSALKSDEIDVYPEFTGTVLTTLVKNGAPSQPLSEQQTYNRAAKLVQQQYQMKYLAPMKYENTFALAVKTSFSKKYHLKSIADLKRVQSKLHAGFSQEFANREDGWLGIQKKYQIDFPVKQMQPSLRYEAITKNDINICDVYTTDSQIKQYHLTVLSDPEHVFPPYQGAPLMKTQFADQHPKVVTALNQLRGKITAEQMRQMNYEVNVQKRSAAEVAKRYLQEEGLLKGSE